MTLLLHERAASYQAEKQVVNFGDYVLFKKAHAVLRAGKERAANPDSRKNRR